MDKPVAKLMLDSRSWGPAYCGHCEEEVEEVFLMPNATLVCTECLTPVEGFEEFSDHFTSAEPVTKRAWWEE
jgi:hypothetical protein